MKRQFGAAIGLLLLSSALAQAQRTVNYSNCTPPWKACCTGNVQFHFERGSSVPLQAGPWYLYWPMEKQFVVPAPVCCYPYWPSRQVLPKGLALGPPPVVPAVPPAAVAPVPVAPAAPVVPGAPATMTPPAGASTGVRPASYSAGTIAASQGSYGTSSPGYYGPVPSYWYDN